MKLALCLSLTLMVFALVGWATRIMRYQAMVESYELLLSAKNGRIWQLEQQVAATKEWAESSDRLAKMRGELIEQIRGPLQ